MSRAAREDFAAEDRRNGRASHDRGTNPASAYQRERTFMGGLSMKKNLWRRRFAATIAGGALAINASTLFAVEFANITVENGAVPEANLPTVSIESGQSTPNFFVGAATGVGIYPVRIGESSTDDFQNGVLLGTIRENHGRTNSLGAPWYVANSVHLAQGLYSTSPVTNGSFQLIVDGVGGGNAGTVANANMAAAYFPFSEGWIGGTSRSTSNDTHLNQYSSFSSNYTYNAEFGAWNGITTIASARYRVRIPGVDDSRRQGLVFANHAKNEDNFASVSAAVNGDGYIISTHHSSAGGFEADPFAFVYIPYDTPGVTMASVHGASGQDRQPTVLNSSGSNFTITRIGEGTYRLSIPGQNPSSGTLLMNSGGVYNHVGGGQSATSQHLITYQADGNDWIIQSTDIGAAATTNPPAPAVPPFPQTPTADRGPAFQFAFMPFNNAPTAPGANRVVEAFKDKVLGFNVNVIEYDGTLNDVPGLGGSVTSGTTGHRFQFLRQNKGDFGVAIDGAFPSNDDGIMFASVNQGFRDNTPTQGDRAYGMIAAGDGGGGWEFATHIADPGLGNASSVEFNVNFSAVLIGKNTPFQKAANVTNVGDPITISLQGVNSLNDGVLVAQVNGNNDDFAVVSPAVDGSNWTVTTYDNNTSYSGGRLDANNNPIAGMGVNWLYLPYTANNLVAGRVAADGSLISSTNPAGFTLTKDLSEAGTYLLTIPGKSPADGTLLLTTEETNGTFDNVLVYEASGNAFKIRSIDQVSYEEKQLSVFPSLEDTNFSFAFIDHDAPPTLGGGTFLEADFNQDGNVDGTDLAAWKAGFGTGTTKAQGDATGDQIVDGADFLAWQRQFGASPALTATAAAVPEPTALGLAAVAGLALAACRRR